MIRRVDKKNLFRITAETMNGVEKENKGVSGRVKKKFVMQVMEGIVTDNYGFEAWEDHRELIEDFVEIAIDISKKEIMVNLNKTIRRCCF